MIDVGSLVNGKYRLVRILGDGGMGSVYEARHEVLGTRVAIKVLHPELARRSAIGERFLQEARVAAQIRSPYVVQVTDVDRTPDGHAYIVMELLEGEPLSSALDRQRKLPVPTACGYTEQILSALEAAHALGVIHRDLKPENVFVTFSAGAPLLKLIDFGIAKARRTDPSQKNLTVAGVVMGTAEYMAPEQARSADNVDVRADLYAVGVMIYEMIAGVRPVSGPDGRTVAAKVERGDVVPLLQVAPEVPRELAGLVHRAMAARPELRFATATEMKLALQAAASGKRPFATPAAQVRETEGVASATEGARRVDTVRAPPIANALAPARYPAEAAPPVAQPSPPGRTRGWVVGVVAVSLLLGAGLVGAAIAGFGGVTSSGPSASPRENPVPAGSTISSSPSVRAETAPAAPAVPVPTLVPTRPAGGPARPPIAAVRAVSLAVLGDAGGASISIPSALPSSVPSFPAILPGVFTLPSGLPSVFPSAFPSALPGWPAPPAAAPASGQAPSTPP